MIFRNILHISEQSPLLSENHKCIVKNIASEIDEGSKALDNKRSELNINKLNTMKASDDYQAKVNCLNQIITRRRGSQNLDKNTQSETSAAIHDLYSQRPTDNLVVLSSLKEVLKQAQNSPLLSTIKQYEVKEIMLPTVCKNMEEAKRLTLNTIPKKPVKTLTAKDIA